MFSPEYRVISYQPLLGTEPKLKSQGLKLGTTVLFVKLPTFFQPGMGTEPYFISDFSGIQRSLLQKRSRFR